MISIAVWICNARFGRSRPGSRAEHFVRGRRAYGGPSAGAFDGDRLVGYTLAVVGLRGRVTYLHSHMTGVHSEYRDRGVGRLLKLFQRGEALGRESGSFNGHSIRSNCATRISI